MALPTLRPPTKARKVTSGWGADRSHRGGTHQGLDFPGRVGDPVLAAAAGTVVQVKNVDTSFAGKFVAIEHSGGVVTRYMHNLKNLVQVGQRVASGQVVALLGQTGTSGKGTPHVHFDVKLKPSAFIEYREKFGTPTPGYLQPSAHGVGVPAEALVAGAVYTDRVRASSLRRGVQFHKGGVGTLVIIAIGAGLGILAKTFR